MDIYKELTDRDLITQVTNEEKVKNNGVWNIYYKGELMASFDGKQEPLFDNPEKTIEKYEKMYQKKHNDFNKESYEE